MQDNPSITIIFNRETWELAKVLYNAQTDKETDRLRDIVGCMLVAVKERHDDAEPS